MSSKRALWDRLKQSQLGVEFLLDAKAKGFRVDFFCPAAQLALEIEEPTGEAKAKGRRSLDREERLAEKGIVVLRLGSEISVDEMVERIDRKLHFLQVERQPSRNQIAAESEAGEAA